MESRQKQERLEKNLELVNYWIDKADTKVSISLGVFPLLSAVMSYFYSTYCGKKPVSFLFFEMLGAISLVLIIVSVVYFVTALKPKLGSSGDKERKKYPLYFGDICKLQLKEYKSLIADADESDYIDELLNEIYYNSRVCYCKMAKFKKGICFSILSIIAEALCFVGSLFL